jgi:thiol-disulfide isomerase/thioredoxin
MHTSHMINKVVLIIVLLAGIFLNQSQAFAADQVVLHLFWAKGCPHCTKEKAFLTGLNQRHPQLIIKEYEISDQKNVDLLVKVGRELQADIGGVPFTVIGEEYVSGYMNDDTTGKKIEAMVVAAFNTMPTDLVASLQLDNPQPTLKISYEPVPTSPSDQSLIITLPVLGTVNAADFSLPALTVVIALLDGFNPCAMWVLLFLISMLLGMKDRKRMWLLGTTFIVASAVVYFLFLSAWLNLFLFLGFVVWIRYLVGAMALGVGSYQLRDYFVNRDASCHVVSGQRRTKIFAKIKQIVAEKSLFLAMAGMVVLAAAVNVIELICSAGLPAIYTHILSLSNLSTVHYYLLLLLYMLVFMLDDLIVFFIAMTTLKIAGVENKYARASHLIGGILVFILGLLMLFKPEWLMFG